MIIARQADLSDIASVLELQSNYLYANLCEEERKSGFVTTPFTTSQLEEIINLEGLFVAQDKNEIVAYVFAGSWQYFDQWPIFPYMTSRFPKLKYKNWNITTKNSFQYGPVCIRKDYRSKGLINQIFEEMRKAFVPKYPISVTFINQANEISVMAHTKKLGWQIIDEFEFNNNRYFGLAIEMDKSVLK